MKRITLYWFLCCWITACQQQPAENKLFTLMEAQQTGIHFTNQLAESQDFNILTYLYYFNGGGVAAGDVNNDGLPDLYFTANELPNKLYLNQGNFQFQDITEAAQVAGQEGWTTGVTMADVNGDGWLDIYVSQLGDYEGISGHSQLYINNGDTTQGIPTFTEQAKTYGLDQQSFATQAAFFDYDLDGDLDVYLLNHTVHSTNTYVPVKQGRRRSRHGDKLMRNEDGRFIDVSEEAGIYSSTVGYGLSISIADLDHNGYPDIYVGNDFHENDYLYYNNGNGPDGYPTFTEALEKVIGHTSRFSMGNDIGDFNNDGKSDMIVLDMKPEEEQVLKASAGEDPYDIYQYKLKYGYNHQYARNTLQLNVGDSLYSEIGQLSGIAATDWSWSALWADFDLDGWKDLFITNGIFRRPNNLDYIKFISSADAQQALHHKRVAAIDMIRKMPSEKIANYAYHNNGALPDKKYYFTNQAEAWGLSQPGFSNGAAYADLDNDGDLDLIINNINDEAFVYRNNAREMSDHHYLKVRLKGNHKNTLGLGTKVYVYQSDSLQYQEMMPTRGFISSVEPVMLFGTGKSTRVDSVVIIWPDSRQQTLQQVTTDQTLLCKQEEAQEKHNYQQAKEKRTIFTDITKKAVINYQHQENAFIDFNRESLMPHMLSREGPALAVGDVNGDRRDDFYIGGAKGQAGALFLQKSNNEFFTQHSLTWQKDSAYEDVDAAFFDADGDHDLDLYVASAGNEFTQQGLEDRLYLNDGKGTFTRSTDALPALYGNTSCVRPADFDDDGDLDLFVGSRVVTGNYGLNPKSYLLENVGSSPDREPQFKDVTLEKAAILMNLGMVSDAVWSDVDGDGKDDLMIVGEWISPVLLRNTGTHLQKAESTELEKYHGWWNTIISADLDDDGDADFVAGNLGLNTVFQACDQEPVMMYVHDFDQNGSLDQVLSYYNGGISYPFASRDELIRQIVPLRKKFVQYADYANSTMKDIFSTEQLQDATTKKANYFASGIIENLGNGTFSMKPLPTEAQFSPVYAITTEDFDGDGFLDILLGGNFYAVGPKQGRYDASYGLLLKGDGKGNFDPVGIDKSGFIVRGETKAIKLLKAPPEKLIIVAKNNDLLQVFTGSSVE